MGLKVITRYQDELGSQTEIKEGKGVQDSYCFEPRWVVWRKRCLEKEIDLELILQQWQVIRLKELDADRAQKVRKWLQSN